MTIFKEEQNIILQDPEKQLQDTSLKKITFPDDTTSVADSVIPFIHNSLPVKKSENSGIITVNLKNRVGDIIYYDNPNLNQVDFRINQNFFPFGYIDISKKNQISSTSIITSHLRDGKEVPQRPFSENWIILLIVISAFIYSSISIYSGKQINNIKSFLLFKGIGDPASREISAFSRWNILILNLVTFVNLSLFVYMAIDYNDFKFSGISGIALWAILLTLVTIMIPLRKIVCLIIGKVSGETAVFGEYSYTISQSYYISGFIFFILTILLAYTDLLNPDTLMISGIILLSASYIIRILRLFFIFLKGNISILYLILYLCALEFLPVMIITRYFTSQF